jgi:hypothetical protein
MVGRIKIDESEKLIIDVSCGCSYAFDPKNGVVFTIGNCPKHDEQLAGENEADNIACKGYWDSIERIQNEEVTA